MHKAVFLDRDGVINDNTKHVNKPQDLILYEGVGEAILRLNKAGYMVFVVTNQGGVGSGFMREETLHDIHKKMEQEIAKSGGRLQGIEACTHHPKSGCGCRKPKPGMITALVERHKIDVRQSWLVGDMPTDCEAAKAAGVARCIILRGETEFADHTCLDLREAVDYICNNHINPVDNDAQQC